MLLGVLDIGSNGGPGDICPWALREGIIVRLDRTDQVSMARRYGIRQVC